MMDANENLNNGRLEKALRNELHMVDAVKLRTNKNGPKTFFIGSAQVDRIWITQDLLVSSACFLPFWFEVGDHRCIIVAFPSSSVLGDTLVTIKKPKTRCLVTTDDRSVTKYIWLVKQYNIRHNLNNKLDLLINQYNSILVESFKAQLNKLDSIKCDGQSLGENKCRKLKTGGVDFSPELKRSRARLFFWDSLKKYFLLGKGSLTGIYRLARSCNICYPLRFSEETVIVNESNAKKNIILLKNELPGYAPNFFVQIHNKRAKI